MILSRLFSELEVGSDSELLMSLLYKQKSVESSRKPEPTDEPSAITLYKVREQIILVIIYIYTHNAVIRQSQYGFTKGKSCHVNSLSF